MEKIADDFVEAVLRDHPVALHELDTELEEFMDNNEKLKGHPTDLEFKEYLASSKKKEIYEQLDKERIFESEKILKNGIPPVGNLGIILQYTDKFVDDDVLHELLILVSKHDRVKIERMYELEESGQDDAFMPNVWLYHRESDRNKVLDYIRSEYDDLRLQDELEEGKDEMA